MGRPSWHKVRPPLFPVSRVQPHYGGHNPVLDLLGQIVRPLIHGLIGDPNGLSGSSDCPAQHFYGFGLFHIGD